MQAHTASAVVAPRAAQPSAVSQMKSPGPMGRLEPVKTMAAGREWVMMDLICK